MSEKKKRFLITCTELMMLQFLVPHVNHILECGDEVDIACSEVGGRFEQLSDKFIKKINTYKINATRSPWTLRNFDGYRQLEKIIDDGNYDIIWTNEPVMGVITRLAALKARKRKHTKVLYMAHGFHFYDGAPLLNWVIYYPIEKFMSRYTDVLVTINKEDYSRARRKFHTPVVHYIPGIGVDIEKFQNCKMSKHDKRTELGIPDDAFVLLSVGELANRKNQRVVIEAFGKIKDPTFYYVIAGRGPLKNEYAKLAEKLGIEKNLLLLGSRTDIAELCRAADVFVHPSVREGLGIAPLEAMATGLPLISTYINGMKDYTQDGVTGCCLSNPLDVDAMVKSILKMRVDKAFRKQCSANNVEIAKNFDLSVSIKAMATIYKHCEDFL